LVNIEDLLAEDFSNMNESTDDENVILDNQFSLNETTMLPQYDNSPNADLDFENFYSPVLSQVKELEEIALTF
jgi:hypothetical protein